MTDINKVLEERGKTHGDFTLQAECTQTLEATFMRYCAKSGKMPVALPDYVKEGVHMILHKLARAATGQLETKDHWDDIAGYAKLISDRVAK